MKFGIEEHKGQILCANCGRVVSKTNELTSNFCNHCGNPLSLYAIDKKETEIKLLEQEYFAKLKSIANELKTDSFEKILKEFEE